MGFASKYKTTERIQLDDDYWVEINPLPTSRQRGAAVAKLDQRVSGRQGQDDVEVASDFAAWQEERAVQAITGWNLDDDDGRMLPLHPIDQRRKIVSELPAFVVDRINEVIEEWARKVTRDKTDQERFRSVSESDAEGGQ